MRSLTLWLGLLVIMAVGVCQADPVFRVLLERPGVAAEVGITDDQRGDLADLFEATEKDIITSEAEIKIKRIEIERLARSDRPDMRQIRKLVSESEGARTSAILARIERRIKMKEILTVGQMEKVRTAIRARAREIRSPGRGRWGGAEGRIRGERRDFIHDRPHFPRHRSH